MLFTPLMSHNVEKLIRIFYKKCKKVFIFGSEYVIMNKDTYPKRRITDIWEILSLSRKGKSQKR